MHTSKLLCIFLLLSTACDQRRKPDAEAKVLADSAFLAMNGHHPDLQKAIVLLDQAIAKDLNYSDAYRQKTIAQTRMGQYQAAAHTAEQLKKLEPESSLVYELCGGLYEMCGDTVSAFENYTQAIKQYDKLLDTMSTKNKLYTSVCMNKAVLWLVMGHTREGTQLLKQVYELQTNDDFKPYLLSMMNKSRPAILEERRTD